MKELKVLYGLSLGTWRSAFLFPHLLIPLLISLAYAITIAPFGCQGRVNFMNIYFIGVFIWAKLGSANCIS
jgi:hypothetical protein